MKIAIVHDFLTKVGGAEKVLSVVHDIFPDVPIYTLLYDRDKTSGLFNDPVPKIFASSLNDRLLKNKKLMLAKYPETIEEFDFSEYDIVISFSNSFAHGILTGPSTLHICYCYSPMRFVWDWHHQYLNENKIGFNLKGYYVRNLLSKIRMWDKISSERVDLWLAQSKTAANRIKKYYHKEATVIYPPASIEKIPLSRQSGGDYSLIVSRLEPYKKIDIAIMAYNKLGRKLIIIGDGSDAKRLRRIANKNITFLGWQSNDSVIHYITNSYCLIFPGEEDFGLTPIEAMAAGKPVIAYRKGGVTETVLEGETGLFFDQPTPESLITTIKKLDRVYNDLKPGSCRKRAELFSTEAFRKELVDFITKSYDNWRRGKK